MTRKSGNWDWRSRRNLLRMGTIAASAMLAISTKTKPVDAVCATARGCNCFLKGTTIRTSDGDKRIEDLAVGDLLPTVFGGIRPIQRIGRYQFRKNYPTQAWPEDAVPIWVARSSLGPNVPHADLFVTKAHALLIDDVLAPACNLINGTTIALYDARALDELEFFHIKLELHDLDTQKEFLAKLCGTSMRTRSFSPNIFGNMDCQYPATLRACRCLALVAWMK